jgi:hypothetical protein
MPDSERIELLNAEEYFDAKYNIQTLTAETK